MNTSFIPAPDEGLAKALGPLVPASGGSSSASGLADSSPGAADASRLAPTALARPTRLDWLLRAWWGCGAGAAKGPARRAYFRLWRRQVDRFND
jgi:hypothetical protein